MRADNSRQVEPRQALVGRAPRPAIFSISVMALVIEDHPTAGHPRFMWPSSIFWDDSQTTQGYLKDACRKPTWLDRIETSASCVSLHKLFVPPASPRSQRARRCEPGRRVAEPPWGGGGPARGVCCRKLGRSSNHDSRQTTTLLPPPPPPILSSTRN